MQMAEYIAGNIAHEMDYAESSIKLAATTISQSMTSDTLDNPTEIITPMIANTPFDGIEYITADGMNIMTIGEPFNACDRIYYIEGIKGNTGVWNNFHPKTAQETLMNFYTPIMYQGKISGVLTGYIAATTQISTLFETKLYGQDIYGFLIDENDMIICSTMESEYVKDLSLDLFMEQFGITDDQKKEISNTINNATEDAASYIDPSGKGRLCVAKIPDTEWKVVIVIPETSLNAIASYYIRDAVIIIFIISLILISYATHILVRNIKRRRAIAKENLKLEEENRIFNDERTAYFNTLGTLASVYNSMHVIDIVADTIVAFSDKDKFIGVVDPEKNSSEKVAQAISILTTDECRDTALEFTDLNTLADRMKNKSFISMQLISKRIGWFLASFIALETDSEGRPTKVILTTQNIDEAKKQEEQLIHTTRTDELTRLLNRRAYEEDIYAQNNVPVQDNFVSMILDVNGLKTVNDTLGHDAGDELLIGASQCMTESFGKYGHIYRTGGDEFIAILFCDNEKLKEALTDFDKKMSEWKGELANNLSISYGYVRKEEKPEMSVRELASIADKRMYEAKAAYYRNKGVDRRASR